MSTYEKDYNHEQQHVEEVIVEIQKKIKSLQVHVKDIEADAGEIRSTFWQDVTVNLDEPDDVIESHTSLRQQAELLSERERSKGQLDQQLKTLKKMQFSPYFGRIIYKEQGEPSENIYIGIASLMDREQENFLVYDWRAPISSLYYDYSPGPAQYLTPNGMIKGDMELKRQFIIRHGEIEAMFDTGITIGDELLLEVLGNNANTQMKSIVATIQKEQNQIIRDDHSSLLVVQGVAGSGKTSAALQRVAYLLYKHRETLKSDNIMLFSPNPLFNSYISTVLPELGEENMQQTTFQEYINSGIGKGIQVEDSFDQLEYLLKEPETKEFFLRLEGIQFKGSLAFKEIMDQYIESLANNGMLFTDIIFRGKVLIHKEEIKRKFYETDPAYSMPNRMELIQQWLRKEMKAHARKERKAEWVENEIQFLDKEDYLNAYQLLHKSTKKDTFDDFEKEQIILSKWVVNRKLKPIYKKIKRFQFIDYKKIYLQLFNMDNSNQSIPARWKEIGNYTTTRLEKDLLLYEDATPFLYLKNKLEGKRSKTAIRHVFIDEAQDYSAFQYAFIKQLFPYSKMTLLGDINQAIYSHAKDKAKIFSLEDESVQKTILLKRSYRSTKEIVEFTKGLIKGGEVIEPFNRTGNKPTISKFNILNSMEDHLINRIKKLQTEEVKTIAVICKTAVESKEVYARLRTKLPVRLMEKGTIHYEQGVLVIPAYLAKGIEFDAVIIYNASNYNREMERELFYTACTRAMHELFVYLLDEDNPFIEELNPETYVEEY